MVDHPGDERATPQGTPAREQEKGPEIRAPTRESGGTEPATLLVMRFTEPRCSGSSGICEAPGVVSCGGPWEHRGDIECCFGYGGSCPAGVGDAAIVVKIRMRRGSHAALLLQKVECRAVEGLRVASCATGARRPPAPCFRRSCRRSALRSAASRRDCTLLTVTAACSRGRLPCTGASVVRHRALGLARNASSWLRRGRIPPTKSASVSGDLGRPTHTSGAQAQRKDGLDHRVRRLRRQSQRDRVGKLDYGLQI